MTSFTPIQKEILRVMNKHGRPMIPSEMAKEVKVSSTTILKNLKELETEGVVYSEIRNNKKYWLSDYF